MNPILIQIIIALVEQVGLPVVIDVVLPILEQNPATLAQYRSALLGAADGIYRAYGISPPAHV